MQQQKLLKLLPKQVLMLQKPRTLLQEKLFKLLKKHGANFEAIDHGGNKPATLAAKAGRKKSKELLEEALVK